MPHRFRYCIQAFCTAAIVLSSLSEYACSQVLDLDATQCHVDTDCSKAPGSICDTTRGVCTSDPTSPNVCDLARPPSRPSASNAGDTFETTVAVDAVDVGDSPDNDGAPRYTRIGYDLDGFCSPRPVNQPCKRPAWVKTPATTDGEQGRDNGVGAFVYFQSDVGGLKVISSQGLSLGMQTGSHNPLVLFRIKGYSGFGVDDQVEVEWYDAISLDKTDGRTQPKWDGTDRWNVSLATASSHDAPSPGLPPVIQAKYVDRKAYVQNYELIAQFPNATTTIVSMPTPVFNAKLVGKLVQDAVSLKWSIDHAVLSGYAEMRSFLGIMPSFGYMYNDKTVFCRDDANYPFFKEWFCSYADGVVQAESSPSQFCNAISFNFAITTKRVELASLVAPSPRTSPCTPENDILGDTCETPPSSVVASP